MLELVDRLLELSIQHHPVGDDQDLVEYLLVVLVMKAGQAVGSPGDGVGLPGASRVLDQVALPRPVVAGIALQAQDAVPLVVAGEDHPLSGSALRWSALLGSLDVDEAAQDVEPGVPTPHPFPEVGGPISGGVHRVAGAAVRSEVEGEELGVLAASRVVMATRSGSTAK